MYKAPVAEISHVLKTVTDLGDDMANNCMGDLSEDLLDAILEEAGKFASEEIAPLSRVGDQQGARLDNGVITMPAGWADLYQRWIAGGWNSLTGPTAFGGQGLPMCLANATFEMWNSGSLAFGIGPTLTIGAVEAINSHASDDLQQRYLEKLISGEWTGTMNLTEPQAGSDLSTMKTKAEPQEDGTYRITGQKIYITYGEHDLTENIVHLVLARLPDAPAGTRGISLFLVPKFLVNDDGSLGVRNDVFCSGMEHKLGIHASPTCTMIYGDGFAKPGDQDGAIGWLVGERNCGLNCMFTMMNNARLLVGVQGVAVAEAAYQRALAYANERRQGLSSKYENRKRMAPIVHHPDVQRNLLTMKALTQAARAISYNCAFAIDRGDNSDEWRARAELLTPIAKAFATDVGCEVASIGVQVHGGMGYIEETGAVQLMRDARIAPIYEGTNGIQAIDLVTRKLPLHGGETISRLLQELRAIVEEIRAINRSDKMELADSLDGSLNDASDAVDWLRLQQVAGNNDAVLAGATPFLRLMSLAIGACYLAKSAVKTLGGEQQDRLALAHFFALNLCCETTSLRIAIMKGHKNFSDAAKELVIF